MSAANLHNTCPVCGAEESLDALLHRMIDDDSTRRLLADVVTMSLPLGGKVVQYLRLHKPAKHVLALAKVHKILAELVPDMRRGAITARGRDWVVSQETWRTAFDELSKARDRGTLELPLQGNSYLYAVLVRLANSVEADAERARELERQQRAYRHTSPAPLDAVLPVAPVAPVAPVVPAAPAAPAARGVPAWIHAAADKLRASSAGVIAPPAASGDETREG